MTPTTDPSLRSFISVPPESHFPIQNLPFGVFCRRSGGEPAVGVAIGGYVLDVRLLEEKGLVAGPHLRGHRVFDRGSLNAFMALGRPAWDEARSSLSRLLRKNEPALRDNQNLRQSALVPMAEV